LELALKYLITGAAGFVGSSITDRLLSLGHEVIGIDCFTDYYSRSFKEANLAQARDNSKFKLIQEDLVNLAIKKDDSNLSELHALVNSVDVIFHQAAQAGVRASWGASFNSYTHNNIFGTQVLLEACKNAPKLKKVVYASSSSIYGNAESLPTIEKVIPAPVSPYGVSKLAAEHLMQLYASEFNVPTISLRYFTVFGPRQRPDMAFNRWSRQALSGEAITLYGDGSQSRDFTFISDIVDANIAAADCLFSGQVYNLGGGTQATVNEVLSFIEKQVGKLEIVKSERQKGDAKHTSADTKKAQTELGFSPKVSLEQGLLAEIAWMDSLLKTDLAKHF
jgi:nucleoside-diphosphate-sugar epimerase